MALDFGALDSLTSPFSAFRYAGREALAFAKQASLLHRDTGTLFPAAAAEGEHVVVLLHGLFATAGVLRPMRQHIEREASAHTASFSYVPGPGVESVARRLGDLIARLPHHVHIHLVGHSMGGLVARYFLQELGGDRRVVQSISLASPFAGTRHARFMPGAAGRDITPGSPLLQRLAERAEVARDIPHLSIVAGRDSVVTESSRFHHGDTHVVADSGHNGLLYHPEVAQLIADRVRATRRRPTP